MREALTGVADSLPPTGNEGQTAYVVLVRLEGDGEKTWRFVENVHASNSDQAIRNAAAEREGVYVAVPARSFAPRTVTLKTEKRVQLS